MKSFELGPIRPPSEATSILLRMTRNCPWNRCAFCHSYKDERFSMRKVDEVKGDIDIMFLIVKKIEAILESKNFIDEKDLYEISSENDVDYNNVRQVAFWMQYGLKNLFLQDADSLVIQTEKIVAMLSYICEKFPSIERITTYARAKTISRKSLEELRAIRKAGLNRIHIGMESGNDRVLNSINKGVTSEEHIIAGKNAKEAGFEVSEYFMPGIGGKDLSIENAFDSARVLNAINPDFIRLRSVVPLPGTLLGDLYNEGKWVPLSEVEKVEEIKYFIEHLNCMKSIVKSDHIMNLLEDVEGKLPDDKEKMISLINSFLTMDVEKRESFIIGRRIGRFRFLSDYREREDIEKMKQEMKNNYSNLDEALLQILWNYI